MANDISPLHLVFFGADRNCKIHLLPLKKTPYHLLDFSDQNFPQELINWDAVLRDIYSSLNKHWPGISTEDLMPDYREIDTFAENQVIILFVRAEQLRRKEFYANMLLVLRHLGKDGPLADEHKKRWKETFPCPVLTVSEEDFMALYAETPFLDYDPDGQIGWKSKRWAQDKNLRLYRHVVDHRVKFLDSSIWHRYIYEEKPGDKNKGHQSFADRFCETLDEIVEYRTLGLYKTRTALSTLEFQCRMFLHSYIQPVGSFDHHEAVTPFKFHSEALARKRANYLLDFLKKQTEEGANLGSLHWDLLMIDDYAERKLSAASTSQSNQENVPHTITKKELIEYLVAGQIPPSIATTNALTGRSGLNARVVAHTNTPTHKGYISQAIELLQKKKDGQPKMYDIILLDYLLGSAEYPEEKIAQKYFLTGLREYGHEFLLELDEKIHQTDGRFPNGPLGNFWIFPISTFPYAFADKLRQLGMDNISDNWFISNGGDPVSAPEMFRWTFFQMLWQQISRCYLHPEGLSRWLGRFSGLEDREKWCEAIETNLEAEKQKLGLLKSIWGMGSEFCKSMANFMEDIHYEEDLKELLNFVKKIKRFGEKHPNASMLNTYNFEKLFIGRLAYQPVLAVLQKKYEKFITPSPLIAYAEELKIKDNKVLEYPSALFYIPDDIPAMNWFVEIYLNDKKISSLSEIFEQQPNLRRLDLSDNNFQKVPKALLALSQQKLSWLNLNGNPFAETQEGQKLNWEAKSNKEIKKLILDAQNVGLME